VVVNAVLTPGGLDESAEAFRRDWSQARKAWGDRRRWAVVSHSMGGLLARSYVEDDRAYADDVASLILIAPVNGGSNLSKAQTLLQVLQGLKAVNGGPDGRGDAFARLGDGLGPAASSPRPLAARSTPSSASTPAGPRYSAGWRGPPRVTCPPSSTRSPRGPATAASRSPRPGSTASTTTSPSPPTTSN